VRFASLGSGSSGNGTVVQVGGTTLLIDCGFGPGELDARLARLGLSGADLGGVLVTHEHGDHVDGALSVSRRFDVTIYATGGTCRMLESRSGDRIQEIGFSPVGIGDALVEPYPVPHDAREPSQFVIGDGARRLGMLTDTGSSTVHIERVLSGCDALLLECNHDIGMLMRGPYPDFLKRRVAGRFGHLNNASASALLSRLDRSRLQHVVAAHLSEKNNRPELATDALAGALGCSREWIGVATQDIGFDWRSIV
jgi:phosphoribosyl 1,2-cyclic phosphodiesterase